MATPLERAKSDAARNTFDYVWLLRHGRGPYEHERVIGLALLDGTLIVQRPPESGLLRTIQHVADDVALALNIPELLTVGEQ